MISSGDHEPGLEFRHALSRALAGPEETVEEETEPTLQFSFSLRKSLRKQLSELSIAQEIPMRSFVLLALRDSGLDVTDEDLIDRRKAPECK